MRKIETLQIFNDNLNPGRASSKLAWNSKPDPAQPRVLADQHGTQDTEKKNPDCLVGSTPLGGLAGDVGTKRDSPRIAGQTLESGGGGGKIRRDAGPVRPVGGGQTKPGI